MDYSCVPTKQKRRLEMFLLCKSTKSQRFIDLQTCPNRYNACSQVVFSSHTARKYRFLTITLTPYNVKSCKLCLPVTFVKANGIMKARKITLVDRYGIKKATSLKSADKYGRLGLGKQWIEFCEVNKIGDSFKLELIKEEEDTMTHHCSKV